MPKYDVYETPRADLGAALMETRIIPQGGFAGLIMLPVFPTRKKEATFSAITRESILRRRDVKRAPKSAYNRDSFEGADISYKCQEYGHEQPLDDSERDLYASDFDAEMIAVQVAEGVLLREQEVRIAAALFNPTVWTGAALYTDYSADPWDAAGADIVGQVTAMKQKVRANVGQDPDSLLISKVQFDNATTKNTAILERLKYTRTATKRALEEELAAILGIDRVVVGTGVYNAAAEDAALSASDIWSDDYAMVAVTARTNNLAEPAVGRSMLWTADSPENVTVEEYREPQTRSGIYRVRHNVDEKVFDPYFAHLAKIDA